MSLALGESCSMWNAKEFWWQRKLERFKPSRLRARLAVEPLEERAVPAVFRSIDGTGNNLAHSDWGSAGVDLLRQAAAAYADGISALTVGDPARPSPRTISNVIVAQSTPERVISDRFMSAMIYGWGQFLDHDIDLTPNGSPAEPANIDATRDPLFDPPGVIFFNRSTFDPSTGTSTDNPRQQPNVITAFIDGSMIYGSDDFLASALRTHSGGRLKTSPGADGVIGTRDDLLPFNNHTYFPGISRDPNDPDAAFQIANDAHIVADHELYMAGDVRANENIELTSLHTLFVREHNRIADAINHVAPFLGDEVIYQLARAAVIAEIESITYNQWIPTLLGPNALAPYSGYKTDVNPGIATEFSTALFRVGHSMLGDDIEFLDNNGEELRDAVALNEAFFNPPLLTRPGSDIGPILKYLATDPSSEVDNSIVDAVRNFLFGPPGAGGFDLASLNIQRGRDHGLPDYNSARAAYGLPRVTSFDQISSDPTIQAKLQQLYGNVDNIDLWVGGLAEDHVPGTSTGPLIRAALIDQFTRLRDGDRFWYQNILPPLVANLVANRTLADVISDNTEINNLQNNVFFFRLSISGTVFNDLDRDGRRDLGEGGLANRTIQLFAVEDDGSTALVAETTTDANGRYQFNVADGLSTGTFRVREVVPAGWAQTSADPADITFTRGQQSAAGVNFGNATSPAAPAAATAPVATASGVAPVVQQDAVQPTVELVGGDIGALVANTADTSNLFAGTTTATLMGVNVNAGTSTTTTQPTSSTPAPVAMSPATSSTQPGAPLPDEVVALADPLQV
jgi:peroxidase